jgi:hypothetical protein
MDREVRSEVREANCGEISSFVLSRLQPLAESNNDNVIGKLGLFLCSMFALVRHCSVVLGTVYPLLTDGDCTCFDDCTIRSCQISVVSASVD